MSVIAHYEEQVYAGVLGKVIGVYMGRPFEGWPKEKLVARWGLVERYVADDQKCPLVVPDDDISGTFTFIRALEDSGLYADTPEEFFGTMWLNYLVEGKSILWWGGLGHSTEHTAYCRLKSGIPAPLSGSMALNGKIVAEQIGAQIFIDAFGLVAPGNPELAARLARRSARVSHDGEAVNGALVVAAMVAAAFTEKDMDRLLDIGVSVIPANSLIAQVHRDVRAWSAADGNWHVTYERIKARYGYDTYGGNCHIIPNHAIMVMAWCYGRDSFRTAQAIINTAGWDTDCNAANVGSVMGVKVGLAGINAEYDFQAPMADRIYLPSAEGTRHVSDCLREALSIARIGRKVMGWPAQEAAKDGAWHHFSLPGSRHGYLVEPTTATTPGPARTKNVVGPTGARMLAIDFREIAPDHPARVSTQVLLEPTTGGYAVMGSPRIYPGQTVMLQGIGGSVHGVATARLFMRHYTLEPGTYISKSTALAYSEPVEISDGAPFTLTLPVPSENGLPVQDIGIEISGDAGASGRVLIDRVSYSGTPDIYIPDELPRNERNALLGWIVDADTQRGSFSDDRVPAYYVGKNMERGVLVTGTDEWTDYTISARVKVHCPGMSGLLARYQGLQRYVMLVHTADTLQLRRRHDGQETVLAEVPYPWPTDEYRHLALTVRGSHIIGSVDGQPLLEAEDPTLSHGGAGFVVDRAMIGFRETRIGG